MIKITCPYNWICGKEFTTEDLSTSDKDFVASATAKKMTLMFIECPECNVTFSYNTVSGESKASHLINPDQIIIERKTLKEFNAILKKDRVEIPSKYFDYLNSEKFKARLEILKDEDSFSIFNSEKLREIVNIDGKQFVVARQLKGYALSLRGIIEDYGKDSGFFTLDNLSGSITIGEENNRLLFIDSRDHNSLWIFHSDGGDAIVKIDLTLADMISL
jgi:hypothetical protein